MYTWFLLVLYATAVPAILGSPCPQTHTAFRGNCYKWYQTALHFTEAERECNKLPGGHLAAFHSDKEYKLLTELRRDSNRHLHSLEDPRWTWTGLNYLSGTWQFTDGSFPDYLPPGFNLTRHSTGNDRNRCVDMNCCQLDIWDCSDQEAYFCSVPADIQYTQVSNGMQNIAVSETGDGDKNSCFQIDSGCGSFTKMILNLSGYATGLINITMTTKHFACDVTVVWKNHRGSHNKCNMVGMIVNEQTGNFYCFYACDVINATEVDIYLTSGVQVCEISYLKGYQ